MMAAVGAAGTYVASSAGAAIGTQICTYATAQVAAVGSSALVTATYTAVTPVIASIAGYGTKIAGVYVLSRPLVWTCEDMTQQVFDKCIDPDAVICTITKMHQWTACTSAYAATASVAQNVGGFMLNLKPW